MRKRLLLISVFVLLVGGILSGCGGNSSRHVEMSDRVREDFIDEVKEVEKEGYSFLGRDGQYSSAVILDMDINGAPVVVCEYLFHDRGTVLGFLFRLPNGFFGEDDNGRVRLPSGFFDEDDNGQDFNDFDNAKIYFDVEKEKIVTWEEQEGRTYIRVYAFDANPEFDKLTILVGEGYGYESLDKGMSTIHLYGGEKQDQNDFYIGEEYQAEEYQKYIDGIETVTFDTYKEFENYVKNEILGKNAISYTELMSGDNVLTTTAELLDAWEEY